ncbi:serine/threonine protein phosphatase [Candidatus Babeliales bacterium]|nr:serine/threonine protein phosphatase [Candidatus Babeliales bacterium]
MKFIFKLSIQLIMLGGCIRASISPELQLASIKAFVKSERDAIVLETINGLECIADEIKTVIADTGTDMKALVPQILQNKFVRDAAQQLIQDVVKDRTQFPTLSLWQDVCKKLRTNVSTLDARSNPKSDTNAYMDTAFGKDGEKTKDLFDNWNSVEATEFTLILTAWKAMMRVSSLRDVRQWSPSIHKNGQSRQMPTDAFFQNNINFEPFAQKLIANPGDQFYVHGDLHGDIHSLMGEIGKLQEAGVIDDHFRIVPDNVKMFFLGDYTDRGHYGAEVIYTLLRLVITNPDKVILVRGNHEDVEQQPSAIDDKESFREEIRKKFVGGHGLYNDIAKIYDLMPILFYLGVKNSQGIVDYIQCCHGGLLIGYHPQDFLSNYETQYQLVGKLDKKRCLNSIKQKVDKSLQGELDKITLGDNFVSKPNDCGCLWHDFHVTPDTPNNQIIDTTRSNRWKYTKLATELILEEQSDPALYIIHGVIRAHQHGGKDHIMKEILEHKGVLSHWEVFQGPVPMDRYFKNGKVWTFNVGADSYYGKLYGFTWDTYALITVQKNYDDWIMTVLNYEVPQLQPKPKQVKTVTT